MFLLQLSANFTIFLISLLGIALNRRNILIILMCLELLLLSVTLNFIIFSLYFDDIYGQLFALFILTVASAESAIGLGIIISYYRVRGSILVEQASTLRY